MHLHNNLTNVFNWLGLAWWIEVVTTSPRCTYYFGPFFSQAEADKAKLGYLEDLEQEGAQEIVATVKRCKPKNLTVYDELEPSAKMALS